MTHRDQSFEIGDRVRVPHGRPGTVARVWKRATPTIYGIDLDNGGADDRFAHELRPLSDTTAVDR